MESRLLRRLDDPSQAWRALWVFIVAMVVLNIVFAVFSGYQEQEITSFLILVTTAFIAWRIAKVRQPDGAPWYVGQGRIWFLVAIGFLFLALDEATSIHESIDFGVHSLFGMTETAVTDRLDDIIVLSYGIIGLVLLYMHRGECAELLRHKRYFVTGFIFLVAMVFFDAVGNRPDVAMELGYDVTDAKKVGRFLDYLEEFMKLIAEIAFLLGFARTYDGFVAKGSA